MTGLCYMSVNVMNSIDQLYSVSTALKLPYRSVLNSNKREIYEPTEPHL